MTQHGSGKPGRHNGIPQPAVGRLSLYLRQLEMLRQAGQRRISSRQLGESLNVNGAQVRKDLAYFGQFGHAGVGYDVDDLIGRLRRILGTDRTWNVTVVGVGNLGPAPMQYKGFVQKGFRLVAGFDTDPDKIGQTIAGIPVYAMDSLGLTVRRLDIKLAILAVPTEVAQAVRDELVRAGVVGILNFAPLPLAPQPGVAINAVDVAVQLEQLSFQVNAMQE